MVADAPGLRLTLVNTKAGPVAVAPAASGGGRAIPFSAGIAASDGGSVTTAAASIERGVGTVSTALPCAEGGSSRMSLRRLHALPTATTATRTTLTATTFD